MSINSPLLLCSSGGGAKRSEGGGGMRRPIPAALLLALHLAFRPCGCKAVSSSSTCTHLRNFPRLLPPLPHMLNLIWLAALRAPAALRQSAQIELAVEAAPPVARSKTIQELLVLQAAPCRDSNHRSKRGEHCPINPTKGAFEIVPKDLQAARHCNEDEKHRQLMPEEFPRAVERLGHSRSLQAHARPGPNPAFRSQHTLCVHQRRHEMAIRNRFFIVSVSLHVQHLARARASVRLRRFGIPSPPNRSHASPNARRIAPGNFIVSRRVRLPRSPRPGAPTHADIPVDGLAAKPPPASTHHSRFASSCRGPNAHADAARTLRPPAHPHDARPSMSPRSARR